MFKKLYRRAYSDYLMPSRLDEYERILIEANKSGYKHYSIRDVVEKLELGEELPEMLFVHRHDIDTDIKTARKMFEIEKRHGVRTSYYFRLLTLDFDLMREIEDFGSEASYHFEEIAAFAKREHLKSPEKVREQLPAMQEEFLKNLLMIEKRLGHKIVTVASHGDFANRELKIINNELLNDPFFRQRCGLKCECYDDSLMENFDSRISDKPYPVYYAPHSIFDSIAQKKKHIYFLTHPKQWHTSWIDTTRENVTRAIEAYRW